MTIVSPPSTPSPPAQAELMFVRWVDPVLDELGYDPRSAYAERFWLPVLGPTCAWLLRRLAHEFDHQPDGFAVGAVAFARSIGIGGRGGRQGPLYRSIDRCVRFGLLSEEDHGVLGVRTKLPTIDRPALGRLPKALRDEHRGWLKERRRTSTGPATDSHAIRLARSLLDVGAEPTEVVAQLRRWQFDPGTSQRALAEAGGHPPAPDSAGLAEVPQELDE